MEKYANNIFLLDFWSQPNHFNKNIYSCTMKCVINRACSLPSSRFVEHDYWIVWILLHGRHLYEEWFNFFFFFVMCKNIYTHIYVPFSVLSSLSSVLSSFNVSSFISLAHKLCFLVFESSKQCLCIKSSNCIETNFVLVLARVLC